MDINEYIKTTENLTIADVCEKFNVSVPTVYRYLKMNGIKIKKDKNIKRTEEIKKLRSEGKTYQEIADMYKVSRQRIEQIVHDYN
jgi:DNA-binding CsgD family transcriptional regulator